MDSVRKALAELVQLYRRGDFHARGDLSVDECRRFNGAIGSAIDALALPAPELERELHTCREALRTSRSAIKAYATRNPYVDSVLVWLDVLLEESP